MFKREFYLIALLVSTTLAVGCGVKGKPLPPLEPAPLGRGEPNLIPAPERPTPKRKRLPTDPEDWQDSEDFESGDSF